MMAMAMVQSTAAGLGLALACGLDAKLADRSVAALAE